MLADERGDVVEVVRLDAGVVCAHRRGVTASAQVDRARAGGAREEGRTVRAVLKLDPPLGPAPAQLPQTLHLPGLDQLVPTAGEEQDWEVVGEGADVLLGGPDLVQEEGDERPKEGEDVRDELGLRGRDGVRTSASGGAVKREGRTRERKVFSMMRPLTCEEERGGASQRRPALARCTRAKDAHAAHSGSRGRWRQRRRCSGRTGRSASCRGRGARGCSRAPSARRA